MTRSAKYDEPTRTLTITMNGKRTTYAVSDLEPDVRVADPGLRLTKIDGEAYDVQFNEFGPLCTCGDCNFRSRKCKHILALEAVGKLPKLTSPFEIQEPPLED